MAYFVTGGTGFIGRFLVENLCKRKGTIYVLTRKGSAHKLKALREQCGVDEKRIVGIQGDLAKAKLGISPANQKILKGNVKHFYHLAAIYDLSAEADAQEVANVKGTQHALDCHEAVDGGTFHMISSIAAAGLYDGTFREDMFDEATGLDDPYFRTKHVSEGLVRKSKVKWRIYRPGVVVGHSKTGEMDKVDGPYYFFKVIQKLRKSLPQWMPVLGVEGSKMNVVPVDFIADAIDHISHQPKLDGTCFHLTDPDPMKVGEVINTFADAAHAPRMAMRIDMRMLAFVPPAVTGALKNLPPVKRIISSVLKDNGIPINAVKFINMPTRYDNREAERALKGSGIEVPPLADYADKLWDYWERKMDPDLFLDKSLRGNVTGKHILITGASSGIGKATAIQLADAGAHVILVARSADKLKETQDLIAKGGGASTVYSADVSDMASCDKLVKAVLKDFGYIDVLVNNAGRSIRRSLELSFDRFHDFERTMQLNYFGCIRLILGFAPSMLERRSGHVINISSIAVIVGSSPRFSAYAASKSALDAFSRSAAAEFSDRNVAFTNINMPLVRTPMIGPTSLYDAVPTLTPEQAGDMICEAVVKRPKRIATPLGIFMQVLNAVFPKATEILMNTVFKTFPDSTAAKGAEPIEKTEATSEQVALAALLKGVHV